MIQTQSADGVTHQFDDGTDQSVIDKVMKDYAAQPPAAAAPTAPAAPPKAPLSQLDMAGTGVLDPVLGTAQLVTHLASPLTGPGPSESMDAFMKRREADILARAPRTKKRGDPNDAGSYDVPGGAPDQGGEPDETGRVVGNMVSPMTWATEAGPVLRTLGITAPVAAGLRAPTLTKRVLSAAGKGGLTAAEQPVTTGGSYTGEKAEQVTAGAVGGGVLPAIGAGSRALWDWGANLVSRFGKSPEDKATMKAVQMLQDRMSKDIKGGGPTAQEMLDLMNLTPDKPQTLVDVGGEGVAGLTGKVLRQPGPGRQTLTGWLRGRDADASNRLSSDIDKALASDGVKPSAAVEGLQQARSITGKPLWGKAMDGGSLAPLKQQFQDAYVEVGRAEKEAQQAVADAQRQILQSTAKQQRAGNDVYLVNSANTELRAAQAELQKAQGELAHQGEVRQLILGMVNDAQADIDANVPGAVWSPRLQQFLDQPEVKTGLQTGVKLARQKAVTEGVPMNIGEYAIKGYDAEGNAIVGKVPTMRLLAAAKQGLDSELDNDIYWDKLTGKMNQAGVHLDGMRRAFVAELDKLNPDYAAARAVWSGDTASMQAVRYGEKGWQNKRPEEIAADMANMVPVDQEFARLGLAADIRMRMAKMGGSGNEARAAAGDKEGAWLRQQIRPFFRSDDEYNQFINSVDAENRMFAKGVKLAGNSATASRLAEDMGADKMAHRAGFGANVTSGHWLGAAYHAAKLRAMGGIPEDVAHQIGTIVSDPQKSLEVLGGYKPPRIGQPFIQHGAGAAGSLTAQELGLQ